LYPLHYVIRNKEGKINRDSEKEREKDDGGKRKSVRSGGRREDEEGS